MTTPGPLMTLTDIADMNHCSLRHARDVLVKLPGFPPEAPTSTPRNRLWLHSEIYAFVRRKYKPVRERADASTYA